ncbi:recombinase family protein [Anaerotignum propionicum]|uniref:recombinase family protein n=1 Tax=Anaerotignum propionicum TaxID=28446 RepID=UPI0028A0EA01|nr:recombinase family protein [Anaerotignum propionicum]
MAIYARVSTNSADQLKSLSEQVSHFTQLTSATPQWLLVDIYMDVSSSKPGSFCREFNRMLDDCHSHKMNGFLNNSGAIF